MQSYAATRTRKPQPHPERSQRVSFVKLSHSKQPHALHYRTCYDNDKLKDALEHYYLAASPNEQPSRRHTATIYHIPPTTLDHWHQRLHRIITDCKTDEDKKKAIQHAIRASHSGPQRLLDIDSEDQLVSWAFNMQERGYPVSKLTLCVKAMELHMYINSTSHTTTQDDETEYTRPHHTAASQHWWLRFRQRHPNIALRTPHALEKERQKQTKQQVIDEYFDLLEKTYRQHNYEPHQIWAADEVGIDGDGVGGKKVLARKGTI
jgi:hypothetical protein